VSLIREPQNQSPKDLDFYERTVRYFEEGPDSTLDKLENFTKYLPRPTLAKFLARYEIFKKIVGVHGSIVECGVLRGGSLFTWAKLSAILEPANHLRRVIGFDTFEGFPELHEKDGLSTSRHASAGGLGADSYDDILRAAAVFDLNRPVGHIPKIELVRGDIRQSIPRYLEENPQLVVSLLHLDVDLYEPTKVALERLIPRMPRGAVIVFDELNAKIWTGETIAVHEVVGLSKLRIERFPFDSFISYAVL